jgi:L-alanine-DL-glutamate epimerase-like enolase superfamily enzyme
MEVRTRAITLAKRHPLTISRGTSAGSENLIVEIEHEGITGIGEMAPTSGGEVPDTAASALSALDKWLPLLAKSTPLDHQAIETALDALGPRLDRAARAAIDMALWDWRGKRAHMPIYNLLGLNLDFIPSTSVTIGINPPDVVRERTMDTLRRTGAHCLKVKLGSRDGVDADRKILIAAKQAAQELVELGEVASAPRWRVDANGGWSPAAAPAMIEWLSNQGVDYVEQPLIRGTEHHFAALHRDSALPIYADESAAICADIPSLVGTVDGINIKLMKCGGITEALRMVHTARAHGLRVMYGCMSETSLAISAAAHISPLADELDLDSHLNLMPDPFIGAELVQGRIVPNSNPGLGVKIRD